MKKILIVFSISLFSFVSLGACGSENGKETSSSVKQSEEMKNTEDNIAQFENIVEEYFDKQQKLMLKQSEIEKTETDIEGVGNFEELSKHAQDVINSKEYKDWVTVSKKVETFKLEKTEESERYIEAQKALTKYNEIQKRIFSRCKFS